MKTKRFGCFGRLGIVALCILSAAVVLVIFRRQAWFGNLPEEPYVPSSEIELVCLTPGENFNDERTVSWRCDTIPQLAALELRRINAPADTSSVYSYPATGKVVRSRGGKACYYHVSLNRLTPGYSYIYRIRTGCKLGHWRLFEMPRTDRRLSFLYIGDIQDPVGRLSDSLFSRLYHRYPRPDFIALGGDQIERPIDKYWHIWYNSLGSWPATVPLVAATGNHEYIKGLFPKLDTRWVPQFNYPENGPDGFQGRSYYIDLPLVRFIVMDSNILVWPTAVQRHRAWLKRVLAESDRRWCVLMFHHPVYSVRRGRMNPVMRYGFRAIIENACPDLVLQGHDHAYARTTLKGYSFEPKIPVYVISAASPKQYRNGFSDHYDRLGSGLNLYQTVDVTPDSLRYRAFEFNGTCYDEVVITRRGNHKTVHDKALTWPESFRYNDFPQTKKGKKKHAEYENAVLRREAEHRQRIPR